MAVRRQAGQRAAAWCFTYFVEEDYAYSREYPIDPHPDWTYAVMQLEVCPNTGRRHLQGYFRVRTAIGFDRALGTLPEGSHMEAARGTYLDNIRYCTKENSRAPDTEPWEMGTRPQQGKRTDWDSVLTDLRAGQTCGQVILERPHLAPMMRGVETLAEQLKPAPPPIRNVLCYYLFGESGVGKSHRAHTWFPDAYVITGRYYEGKSFDGYSMEDTLILDEWKDHEWPLTLMNSLLDKWKLTLQCRYKNKMAYWTRVLVLSNQQEHEVYYGDPHRSTFWRRFQQVVEVRTREQVIEIPGAVQPDPEEPSSSE